jgi:hypothetical protein
MLTQYRSSQHHCWGEEIDGGLSLRSSEWDNLKVEDLQAERDCLNTNFEIGENNKVQPKIQSPFCQFSHKMPMVVGSCPC